MQTPFQKRLNTKKKQEKKNEKVRSAHIHPCEGTDHCRDKICICQESPSPGKERSQRSEKVKRQKA